MNLRQFSVLLFIILILHQLEEYHYAFWEKVPLQGMTATFFIIFNAMVDVLILAFIIAARSNARVITLLLRIFVVLMAGNGMIHLIWALVDQAYVPGLVTGIGFLLAWIVGLSIWREKVLMPGQAYVK